jgi:hypothetical protein
LLALKTGLSTSTTSRWCRSAPSNCCW